MMDATKAHDHKQLLDPWDKRLLAEYLLRYVFIEKGSKVYDLDPFSRGKILKLRDFRNSKLNVHLTYRFPRGLTHYDERLPIYDVWIHHPKRRTAYTVEDAALLTCTVPLESSEEV